MSSSRLGEKLPPLDFRRPTWAWYAAGSSRHSISTVVFVDGISTPKCRIMISEYNRAIRPLPGRFHGGDERHALGGHLDRGTGAGGRRRLQQPHAADDPARQPRRQPP